MPHPQTQKINAQLGNLGTLSQISQSPVDFSSYLNSSFTANTALTTETYGATGGVDGSGADGPGGTGYAIYTFMGDGSAHLSVAVALSSTGGSGWFAMTSSNLPFAPVTNKYTAAATDCMNMPSTSASAGCMVCLDSGGGLHVMGLNSSAKILTFDWCVPLTW
jgi:hypothetical protein